MFRQKLTIWPKQLPCFLSLSTKNILNSFIVQCVNSLPIRGIISNCFVWLILIENQVRHCSPNRFFVKVLWNGHSQKSSSNSCPHSRCSSHVCWRASCCRAIGNFWMISDLVTIVGNQETPEKKVYKKLIGSVPCFALLTYLHEIRKVVYWSLSH